MVLRLFGLYKDERFVKKILELGHQKEQIWIEIEEGFKIVTGEQCNAKFRNHRHTYPTVGDNNNNLTDQIKSNRNLSAALCMVLAMLYDGNKVFWKDEGGELMISVCLTWV